MAASMILSLRGIEYSHVAGSPILKGLDFDMTPETRVGIVGANGAGKTTLLHIIMGLLRPQKGTVAAFGRVRNNEAEFTEVRARIGLLFQDSDDQLFCPTVAEDVAFGPMNLGRTRAEARAIVAETLELLGLAGFESRITTRLSAGEKRLIALATVLAMKPEALLLDEPDSFLDEQAMARLTDVLQSLNLPMAIISHNHAFLHALVDKKATLRDGIIHPT